MSKDKISPRQQLASFVGRGDLRYALEAKSNGLSEEALELLITIALRYCEPTRRKRKSA